MIRESYMSEYDAKNRVYEMLDDELWFEEGSMSCDSMPCPSELDNWSGEVGEFYVYKDNELFAKIAYWE